MQAETLRLRDWQDALDVQDACNLSGVVLAWARVMQRICNEANKPAADGVWQHGTDWKNMHPINVLYASKCASLTGQVAVSGALDSAFSLAYDYASAVVETATPRGLYDETVWSAPAPYTL